MRNGLVYRKKNNDLLFYVPQSMENNILFKYHDQMGHLGVEKTMEVILKNYWFSDLKSKVRAHISN